MNNIQPLSQLEFDTSSRGNISAFYNASIMHDGFADLPRLAFHDWGKHALKLSRTVLLVRVHF